MRKIYEILERDFQTFREDVNKRFEEFDSQQKEHDKILVRGNGTPSLQEIVRTLSSKVDALVTSIETERKKKEEDKTKWKWALIGVGLPASLMFILQFIVFWVKFVFPTIGG